MPGQSGEVFMLLADCQDFGSFPLYIIPLILRSFVLCPCWRQWPAFFIVLVLMEEVKLRNKMSRLRRIALKETDRASILLCLFVGVLATVSVLRRCGVR